MDLRYPTKAIVELVQYFLHHDTWVDEILHPAGSVVSLNPALVKYDIIAGRLTDVGTLIADDESDPSELDLASGYLFMN